MPADGTFEEKVRQRYRQPRGVEQFGIEPIPDRLKTVRWLDLFLIVVNFLINPGTILISGLAVASGLSFTEAVASQVCGVVVAFSAYVAMATIGVDYGVPGQVATRMAYGLRGAKWGPSLLRTAASVYWFAFQTVAGSMAVVAVLDKWLGGQHSLFWVSIVFAALQVVVALVGYDSLKVLSRFAFPLKLVVFAYLFVLLAWQGGPDFAPARVAAYPGMPGPHWLLFATWLNGAAAAWLTMITDAADFCRYSRTRVDMWVGTLGAAVAGTTLGALLGAYAAAGTLGRTANPFEVVADLSTSWITLLLVFVVIAFDNWTINVLNLYTGGLSLSNIAERLGRFWTTLAVSVLGVALSAVPDVVNGYTGYMNVLGNIFAPMAGVLIADYVALKRTRVDVVALFEPGGPYWYWRGFGVAAIGWTVLGFFIYLAVPMAWLPTAVTPVVTGMGYYATVRLLSARFPTLARAARPGEQRESVDELDQELALRRPPGPIREAY